MRGQAVVLLRTGSNHVLVATACWHKREGKPVWGADSVLLAVRNLRLTIANCELEATLKSKRKWVTSENSVRPKSARLLIGVLALFALQATGCRMLNPPVTMRTLTARELASDGLDALQQDETERAQSLLRKACRMCPDDSRMRIHLARALRRRGDYQEATRELEKAVEKSEEDPALIIELGELQLEQADAQAALELAHRACELAPRLPQSWGLLGRARFELGRNEAAVQAFHKALTLDSENESFRLGLVDCYLKNGQPRRALSNLELLAGKYPPQRIPEGVSSRMQQVNQRLGLARNATEDARWR